MTTIKYRLATGEEIEIEVPDAVAEFSVELQVEAKREKWRNQKRRNVSVDALEEKGYILPDRKFNLEDDALGRLDRKAILAAVEQLKPDEQLLIRQVYFEERNITDLAKERGVSRRSIYYRLDTVHKKLRNLLPKDFTDDGCDS